MLAELLNQEFRWPKLLVLTGSVPGTDGVGAILVKQILDQIPRNLLKIVSFTKRTQPSIEKKPATTVDLDLTRRYEPAYRPLKGLAGELTSYAAQQTLGRNYLNKLSEICVSTGKEFGCEGVLAVMDNPSVIRIAEQVSRKLRVPLYSYVMDDPAILTYEYGFGQLLTSSLRRSFDKAILHSHKVAVIGETMREAYERKYRKKGIILRLGLPIAPIDYFPPKASRSAEALIGFAGSMTARDTYEQLILELDRRKWMLGDKKVILRIIGSHLKLVPSAPQHIEYYGWRSLDELVELTSGCDFLYLPQSFAANMYEISELSFPSKFSSYIPSCRPILLHSPPYGSMIGFYKKFPCGPVCSTIEAAELLDSAENLLLDPEAYEAYQRTIKQVFSEVLNHEQLNSATSNFLR